MAVNQTGINQVNGRTSDNKAAYQRCLLCFSERGVSNGVCGPCYADLVCTVTACRLCARPIPDDGLCGRCLSAPRPPWSALYAAFPYTWPVDRLLQQLKFHQNLDMAKLLSRLCGEAFLQRRQSAVLPDIIVAVPLHHRRLIHRGYNQAQELAKGISKVTRIPLDLRACTRRRYTVSQTGLDARQRRKNLRGAFRATPHHVQNKTVALVDDVVTTASTVRASAQSLLLAGARDVEVWAVAYQALER